MSVKVSVYLPSLENGLLERVCEGFRQREMDVKFHPAFVLERTNTVKVPVRFEGAMRVVELSEFELTIKEFRYTSALSVDPSVNQKLKSCTSVATIRMHSTHTSAFRVGMMLAVLLAEAADGIVYSPRSDAYLHPDAALMQFPEEIDAYEKNLPKEDWRVVPFNGWGI